MATDPEMDRECWGVAQLAQLLEVREPRQGPFRQHGREPVVRYRHHVPVCIEGIPCTQVRGGETPGVEPQVVHRCIEEHTGTGATQEVVGRRDHESGQACGGNRDARAVPARKEAPSHGLGEDVR